jgi:hypothetical protein
MICFSYLTDFSDSPPIFVLLEVAGQSEQVKNGPVERGVDGFSYFSLILSYFIF